MVEHTPGPYHADHSGERIAIWALGDKRVFLGACSEKDIGRRQAEANAALFVASPQLLALLIQAHARVCSLECASVWQTGTPQPHSELCEEIRATIAKARGE